MDLSNSFVVPADIDTAWKTLLDVEAIAPCMPGAQLTGIRPASDDAAPETYEGKGDGSAYDQYHSEVRVLGTKGRILVPSFVRPHVDGSLTVTVDATRSGALGADMPPHSTPPEKPGATTASRFTPDSASAATASLV